MSVDLLILSIVTAVAVYAAWRHQYVVVHRSLRAVAAELGAPDPRPAGVRDLPTVAGTHRGHRVRFTVDGVAWAEEETCIRGALVLEPDRPIDPDLRFPRGIQRLRSSAILARLPRAQRRIEAVADALPTLRTDLGALHLKLHGRPPTGARVVEWLDDMADAAEALLHIQETATDVGPTVSACDSRPLPRSASPC